jgi:hypothetical protein
MHGTLFLGFDRENAKSSIAARRWACDYLEGEQFTPMGRFGGEADNYLVGGRCSGILQLLRLRHEQPKSFAKFWKKYPKADDPRALFRQLFPTYRGTIPIMREKILNYGYVDDAQIMDETLYDCLKEGFDEYFRYSWGLDEKPCVLYCGENSEDSFEEWPKSREAVVGKTWVVVIDYHY